MEVGLSLGDIVLDGDLAPLPQKGAEPPPQFSAHFYCGQTAGCIKIPLGMDVGLSPGDFVLDGEPVTHPRQRGCCTPFAGGRAGSPSNTMWPGPRPIFVPSSILIHPAVWPQQACAENGGLCPLFGEGEQVPI